MPILFCRLDDTTGDPAWQTLLAGAYNVTPLLDALVVEAVAKNCGILVTAALVPLPSTDEEPAEEPEPEPKKK